MISSKPAPTPEPLYWHLLPVEARVLFCVPVVEQRTRVMVLSGALARRVQHLRRIVPAANRIAPFDDGAWPSASAPANLYARIHALLAEVDRLALAPPVASSRSRRPVRATPARWIDAVVAYEEADDLARQFADDLLRAHQQKAQAKESARLAALARTGRAARSTRAREWETLYVDAGRVTRENARRQGERRTRTAIARHLATNPPAAIVSQRKVDPELPEPLRWRQIFEILKTAGV